jgi:peptide/nickel transport system substrate-binding protein
VQGLDGLNTELAKRLQADNKYNLLTQPGMNVGYLAMNMDKPPFDKKEVRLAINYAIDRDAIVQGLYGGFGTPAVNPMPPTLWGYNRSVQAYPHDPARARALLAQAGFPNGFKTVLWAMNGPRPYMPDPLKIAEAIQANLKEVGIDASVHSVEWGTYLDQTQHGRHEMCLMGWTGDNGDPDNFLYTLLDREAAKIPAQNIAFYRSDALHDLLVKAQEVSDMAERTALYEQAQTIVHDDAPWVPIAHMTQLAAFDKRVHGYVLNPTGKVRFRKTWIEPGA